MLKLTVSFLVSFLFIQCAIAQSGLINGKISDTVERKDLANGAVLLLRTTDSIMVRFARTDKEGAFHLKNVPTGKYLLMVTYPAYADYTDQMEVKDSLPLNLPPISMVLKSALLKQVVVTGSKAIYLKGDTLEFKADSFHTQPGATVEDLLKKLPGIQVDRNGKITAQGETVQKVLVDGEEFFGDDPTLVTQNLRADMIDKVQVFDKKSDQATFTGIDDGVKNKTINLKLKDNKKNGYFGRLSAGVGTNGYYDNQVMANLFKKKQKVALYGIYSNTGKIGLNWQERDNYGQSGLSTVDYDENTGMFSGFGTNTFSDELDNWSGQYNGQGFPSVKTGGIHYNDKWGDDRNSINGNYKILNLNIQDSSQTNTENILPDTLYYTNQKQRSSKQITRNNLDGIYEVKFDSTSTLKIMADGGTDHKNTKSWLTSEFLARDSSLVNQNTRTITDVSDTRAINSNILWRKKLAKKGRTFSANFRENYSNVQSSGYLYSDTRYFSGGLPSYDSLIDQYKQYHTTNTLIESRIAYTEPLSAISFLTASYGVTLSRSHSDRNSFNKSPADHQYSMQDSLYSNNYDYNVFIHRGGLLYSLVKKKFRINAGNNIGFASFDQRDVVADTSVRRNFINWYPQANVSYSFTSQKRLNLFYTGNTVQPTINQIQPIRTNENPLNITIGNPGLKPSFNNRFNLWFSDYKVLTERYIGVNASYGFTQNAISSRSDIDKSGRRVNQSINVDGNFNANGNLNYYFKWRKPDLGVGFHGSVNFSSNANIVNGLFNKTRSGGYTIGMNLNKNKDKKYEIGINPSATYTDSKSSINTGISTNYWMYSINGYLGVYLPLKFEIHGDCDVSLRQKTSVFDNNTNVTLLNAWIGKKFLKNDALLIKASGSDILNQNLGVNRTVNSNFISQNTYSTIKRYFMFSVVWNFTKAGTPAPKD